MTATAPAPQVDRGPSPASVLTPESTVRAPAPPPPWADAITALALFAVDPHGLGGVLLRARSGPVRDRWLEALREVLPESSAVRRVPLHIGDGRLLGGLDLAATLSAGRPIAERGLLAEIDGGVALVAMAERAGSGVVAKIGAALDHGQVCVERDGFSTRFASRFGVVALDESADDDECVPAALRERLAFLVDLTDIPLRELIEPPPEAGAIMAARDRLAGVVLDDAMLEALCATALALGVDSPRSAIGAVRAARAAAALAGRDAVTEADASVAARLVFAPRATRLPPDPSAEPPQQEPAPAQEPPSEPGVEDSNAQNDQRPQDTPPEDAPPPDEDPAARDPSLDEQVLAAVRAAIPAGLLALLQAGLAPTAGLSPGGRSGATRRGQRRGRPAGSRPGDPRSGTRLALVDTLRAAAPWQPLRQRERAASAGGAIQARRIDVRRDDFRVQRYRERAQTTTVFAVDASGSQALNRLGEAKGAVELLLADCYVRRDQVALIAFRGAGAEVVLPPTRSLARAKRCLAGLPGGGGTPLAAGIDAARVLVEALRRKGDSVVLILMTDGRGNLARDGRADRERAQSDALQAAMELRLTGVQSLLIDTAARPQPAAARIAQTMGARYLALPYADAAALSGAVKIAVAGGSSSSAR